MGPRFTVELRDTVRCSKWIRAAPRTLLHQFSGRSDGAYPYCTLVGDSAGDLYGTTAQGGSSANFGSVFKVDSAGNESVVHGFTGGGKGLVPEAGLIVDKAGNLYGTTYYGGPKNSSFGTVFKLVP